MKVVIVEHQDRIWVTKDFRDLTSGQASHVLAELELLKQDLLQRWVTLKKEEE